MSNEKLLISAIEYKTRKLIEINKKLSEENKQIKQKLEKANVLIEQLKNELKHKQNKLVEISLANALTNKNGVEKSIEVIDRLVEELDKGIDVLSD